VTETVEAATLLRALRPGEIIKASDITVARRPKAEVGNEGLSAEQATGLAAKNTLRSGQALRLTDLMKPQVVQRNESVTLVYIVPGVMLTVRGKALEAGAVGDVVGVLNIQSNRTIQATVTGPGRVAVAAAGPLLAASNSSPDESVPPRTQ
jgi:flagella basal body P-ring formation protein FlgA